MAERSISRSTIEADDGTQLALYRSLPVGKPKAAIQIAHGIAEHFGRYARLTHALTAAGYAVYGSDHRGHGHSAINGLGEFGPKGFQAVVDDMAALTAIIRMEQPGLPVVLLAHSMGSFAAQLYLLEHSSQLSAVVLSGTAALDQLLGLLLAGGGPVTLAVLNAAFEPGRTGYEWLSRDEAEVDAYVADPLSGFDVPDHALQSIFGLTAAATLDPRVAGIRKDLPIYVISGEHDPVVGPEQAFSRALVDRYRAAGIGPIEHQIYPGGRHEMFNELNRDDVEQDVLEWLDRSLA